jgi:predicted phage-related endonuclease
MEPIMEFVRDTLSYATEAEWLAARKLDLTSTECAALFDASPYCTAYELHHRKTGALPDTFEANERMVWGTRLEAAIAQGVAEDLGLIVIPMKVYMRIPSLRMGSSFDFQIVGLAEFYEGDETARNLFRERGPGIMEVKNVDGLAFRRSWIDDGEVIEAPPHIEFQVQHQQLVSGMTWSVIAPLVGGNTPKPIFRVADEPVQEAIMSHVQDFWARVDANDPPAPNFIDDADTIKRLYRDNDGSSIDLSEHVRLAGLCAEYKAAGADEKAAQQRKQAALAEILTIVEGAKSIQAAGFKISAGTNKESYRCYERAESVRWTITKSVIPAKQIEATVAPFRNVRITELA